MAQRVFEKIQLGRQTAFTTPVAATTLYPAQLSSIELDRGYLNPDEDWGRMDDEQPGRGTWGLRHAAFQLDSQVRFEDLMHLLEMHLAGGVTPTGAGPYTWTYTADSTAVTVRPYSIEVGSETTQDQWRLTGCLITELALGFDQLTAPGNAPWTASARGIALDRQINALTGRLNAPATLETVEGHMTTLYEGTTATAFGSLPELAGSLVSFRLTSTVPYVLRAYGGTSDVASDFGISAKAGATFEAGIKISASAQSDVHDIYAAAGSTVQERRWRIRASGSSPKMLTIDARVRFRTVDRAEREGEVIYGVSGSLVYDPTLGGRVQVAIVNNVATLP